MRWCGKGRAGNWEIGAGSTKVRREAEGGGGAIIIPSPHAALR